jgi:GTP-binding protein
MKIESAVFSRSARTLDECPVSTLSEFAFVGRSNVGKSSLINMLTGKQHLAKTSSVPGKTKLINFFTINQQWHLVDLPGYGFAKVSRSQQAEFHQEVSRYLSQRNNLKCIFALVDARLEPQTSDLEFITWLHDCALPYAIILTKTDKQGHQTSLKQQSLMQQELSDLGINNARCFECSAKTQRGRSKVLSYIESFLDKKPKEKGPKLALNWMNKRKG